MISVDSSKLFFSVKSILLFAPPLLDVLTIDVLLNDGPHGIIRQTYMAGQAKRFQFVGTRNESKLKIRWIIMSNSTFGMWFGHNIMNID